MIRSVQTIYFCTTSSQSVLHPAVNQPPSDEISAITLSTFLFDFEKNDTLDISSLKKVLKYSE